MESIDRLRTHEAPAEGVKRLQASGFQNRFYGEEGSYLNCVIARGPGLLVGKRLSQNRSTGEVTTPERIISAFEFKGLKEKIYFILETMRFEALPGNRTKLKSQSVFQKVEDHVECSGQAWKKAPVILKIDMKTFWKRRKNKDLDL